MTTCESGQWTGQTARHRHNPGRDAAAHNTDTPNADMPPRPHLAFRVGITGGRTIAPCHRERIERQVADILRLIRQDLTCLSQTAAVRGAYAGSPGHPPTPDLRFLSPLAEGADRIGAHAALDQGYGLFVPMPFRRKQYEQDFPRTDSVAEFRSLLAQAGRARLELDGRHDDRSALMRLDKARSYEAVGHFVVRNCDLLIAVWDGEPGKGIGGTAEIVRYAAASGPPIWWINAGQDVPPQWIAAPHDLYHTGTTEPPERLLHAYLAATVVPPSIEADHHHLVIERLVHGCRPFDPDPLTAYYQETLPAPCRLWTAYASMIRWAAAQPRRARNGRSRLKSWLSPDKLEELRQQQVDRAARETPSAGHYWHRHYQAADARANASGARFRSVYVLIFLLIAASLITTSCALTIGHDPHLAPAATTVGSTNPDHTAASGHTGHAPGGDAHPPAHGAAWHTVYEVTAVGLETLFIVGIVSLLVANLRHDWHQRWIDCRLLAELCRKQQALVPLGWSLPGRSVATLVEEGGHDRAHRTAWVAWLFSALMRAAPLPTGRFNATTLQRPERAITRDLAMDQWRYHRKRERDDGRAARRLASGGEKIFFVVMAAVLMKIALLLLEGSPDPNHMQWLGLLAVGGPAVAAAFLAIRFYAELMLLERRSRHMQRAMTRGLRRAQALDLAEPLASQELGSIGHEIATAMLQEVDGWARAFRVKVVEAG